jgi:hypothetical protein
MSGNDPRVVVLQDRDRKLLAELAEMRVIDRELAKAVAGFASTTRANARLLALTQTGYLKRRFVGTIKGGRKAVYWASKKGAAAGAAGNGSLSSAAKRAYGELFLEHELRVSQVYVWVKHQTILKVGCQFVRWISFNRPLSKAAALIPDGYFELRQEAGIKAHFLEVDLGSEALRIWQKKIEGYLRLAVSGEFQRLFGQARFKVAVIADSERRSESIRKLSAKFTDKIFRFASFEIINREGFWSAVWQRPVGDQREALL